MILALEKMPGRLIGPIAAMVVVIYMACCIICLNSAHAEDASYESSIEKTGLQHGDFDNAERLSQLKPGHYVLSAGPYVVAKNAVVSSGVVLEFTKGAYLDVRPDVTVTMRGILSPLPRWRIFQGTGSVVGLRLNRPEWWGAESQYGYHKNRDDGPAFNAAMASASASAGSDAGAGDGRPSVQFLGTYYSCTPIDLFPTPQINLEFAGVDSLNGGGSIHACPDFKQDALIRVHGRPNAQFGGSDIFFHDFHLLNDAGSHASIGLALVPEKTGFKLSGALNEGLVSNVSVSGFSVGVAINNSRLLRLSRVAVSSQNVQAVPSTGDPTHIGILVEVSDSKSFSGDIDMDGLNVSLCRSNPKAGSCPGSANIVVRSDHEGSQIKGIRIAGDFYSAESSIVLTASNGGIIGDVWIQSGTQFDGFGCKTFMIKSSNDAANGGSNSLVDDVHIANAYFRGSNEGCPMISARATKGAAIRSLTIVDNWFANMGDTVAEFENVSGLIFSQNTVYEPSRPLAKPAFRFEHVDSALLGNNVLFKFKSGSFSRLAEVRDNAAVSVQNNSCSGIVAADKCH